MSREWFTVAEVRAAGVPSLDPSFVDFLVEDFDNLRPLKARLRRRNEYNRRGGVVEMEFHISLFLPAEQAFLMRTLCSGIFGRILKLGIHRPVSDPRAYYDRERGAA